jgi:hypothetical protein
MRFGDLCYKSVFNLILEMTSSLQLWHTNILNFTPRKQNQVANLQFQLDKANTNKSSNFQIEFNFPTTLIDPHYVHKVILRKSRGEQFLWDRN